VIRTGTVSRCNEYCTDRGSSISRSHVGSTHLCIFHWETEENRSPVQKDTVFSLALCFVGALPYFTLWSCSAIVLGKSRVLILHGDEPCCLLCFKWTTFYDTHQSASILSLTSAVCTQGRTAWTSVWARPILPRNLEKKQVFGNVAALETRCQMQDRYRSPSWKASISLASTFVEEQAGCLFLHPRCFCFNRLQTVQAPQRRAVMRTGWQRILANMEPYTCQRAVDTGGQLLGLPFQWIWVLGG
jgi:hypothetical protein